MALRTKDKTLLGLQMKCGHDGGYRTVFSTDLQEKVNGVIRDCIARAKPRVLKMLRRLGLRVRVTRRYDGRPLREIGPVLLGRAQLSGAVEQVLAYAQRLDEAE